MRLHLPEAVIGLLEERRLKEGWSQAELGRQIGYMDSAEQRNFNHWLTRRSRIDLGNLSRICHFLKISPNEAIDLGEESGTQSKLVHKSVSNLPSPAGFGQNDFGGHLKRGETMGDAKAALIRQVLEMSEEEAETLSRFIAARDAGHTRPTKRGRTS